MKPKMHFKEIDGVKYFYADYTKKDYDWIYAIAALAILLVCSMLG